MRSIKLNELPVWKKLKQQAGIMNRPEMHLRNLIQAKARFEKFTLKSANIFYDFSRQRVDEKTLDLLFELAEERGVQKLFSEMVMGAKLNITENRAALHTALRSFSGRTVIVDGKDVMPEIRQVRANIKEFSEKILSYM